MQYKKNQKDLFTNIKIHKKIVSIIVLSLILLFVFKAFFVPTLNITSPVITELNEEYIPTYESSNFFHDYTNKVKVKSKVNTNKEGNYEVTYTLNYLIFNIKKKQIVSVQYHGIPELTLVGDENLSVCPGKKYEEPGYTAYDKEYGDITDKVKVYTNDNTIIYVVKTRNSKEVTKTRTYKYEDITPPTITLKGDKEITLTIGNTYNEPGYTVDDNCDTDLSNKVSITGSVDTNKIGTYIINYTVIDSSNNKTTISRKINVIGKRITYTPSTGNNIYLTFDDGPSSSITPQILNILKEEQVPATFFVINHSDSLNYLLVREANEGHTVALHSYTHNYAKIYTSDEAFLNDLKLIHDKVYNVTGIDSKVTRFPGGSSNTVSLKYNKGIMTRLSQKLPELGYNYFDWNVDSSDAGNAKNKYDVYNNVTNNLSYGRNNVVLMHDYENNYKTLEALRDIIKYGKENGYTFKKLDVNTYPSRHTVNN